MSTPEASASAKSVAPKLADGRSSRWAFMNKFEVPDYDGEGNYLTRWRVIQTPWAALYLHRFDGPDPRPTLHDHPWNFVSVMLRGGYVERRLDTVTMQVNEHRVVRLVNVMRTHDAHAITRLLRTPSWSLLFVGRRVRTWGYLEPPLISNLGELEPWRWTEFSKHRHAYEFDRAMARRRLRGVIIRPESEEAERG